MSALTDLQHECLADAARERELTTEAPSLSYMHGLKLGRIIELALAAAEGEFCGIRRTDALVAAEALQEAFWSELDLPDDLIDHAEIRRGIRRASDRYAEAVQS